MNMVIFIVCAAELIAGFDSGTGQLRTYKSWELDKTCHVSLRSQTNKRGTFNTIYVECENGEKSFLPESQCAVNYVYKQ